MNIAVRSIRIGMCEMDSTYLDWGSIVKNSEHNNEQSGSLEKK
jgi:hypothetical protein